MTERIGHKIALGGIWATIDRYGSMGIQFIVNLILARLLLPAYFEMIGMIGMLMVFVVVSQTLMDSGFYSALIQTKTPSSIDYIIL